MNVVAINWTQVVDKILDPYELRARLFPGLLVLLPAITYLALLYGTKNPIVVGLTSVLAACGGPYFLSNFVRTWGLRAQERLYRRWGGPPSTLLLRHRDTHLPLQTKLRYHELSASRLGIAMPSSEEEKHDPAEADEAYAAAADALRPLTNDRKAFPFVFKELVAYGFNRNAYGSRWAGFCVSVLTIAATLVHAGTVHLQRPYWSTSGLTPADIVVLLLAAGFAALWCIHFTADTVKVAGVCYAKRLWEALEKLPKKPSRPQNKRSRLTDSSDTTAAQK